LGGVVGALTRFSLGNSQITVKKHNRHGHRLPLNQGFIAKMRIGCLNIFDTGSVN
jgi:hypothetical protein